MRIFGLTITRQKAGQALQSVPDSNRGWFRIISEPFTGAWQRNMELRQETVLTYHAVYACVTLIASDISKCRLCLVEQDDKKIWKEIESSAFSPVLRKPNRYQNRIKFVEQWVVSKLLHGNTYVLKERDNRKAVTRLYVLDPCRVKPLVAPDGAVYYEISRDNLSGIEETNITVPASEIIHDTMVPLFHPLCGVSPLTACGLAAAQGLTIQGNSAKFFQNGSNPGGILTAPGAISDETATRLKTHWENNYTGENVGKVAVLGDGLEYKAMSVNATDAQLIEQLKWTAEVVCSAFHVPAYKVGVGPPPTQTNIEALDQQYYSQCLQSLFENIELLLDEGLGLTELSGKTYGTEFDLDDLLRMDTATQIEALSKAVGGSVMTPNAALLKMNQPPVEGGNTIYMQQQNYSLAALSKRDAQADPFASKTNTPALPAPKPEAEKVTADKAKGIFAGAFQKAA